MSNVYYTAIGSFSVGDEVYYCVNVGNNISIMPKSVYERIILEEKINSKKKEDRLRNKIRI